MSIERFHLKLSSGACAFCFFLEKSFHFTVKEIVLAGVALITSRDLGFLDTALADGMAVYDLLGVVVDELSNSGVLVELVVVLVLVALVVVLVVVL